MEPEEQNRLMVEGQAEWVKSCLEWRGEVLIGKYAHFCWDWDGLPIDETCGEWPCACAESLKEYRK